MPGRWIAALLFAVGAVVVGGVGLLAVVTRADRTAIADLEIGDCFDLDTPGTTGVEQAGGVDEVEEVETVKVIGCDDPHVAEVVGAGRLDPDGQRAYPSDSELFDEIDRRCSTIAVPRDVVLVPVAPTEASWEARGGPYACLAIVAGREQVTGSVLD